MNLKNKKKSDYKNDIGIVVFLKRYFDLKSDKTEQMNE